MRNVFDQFKQPENRLTHALMSTLHEDPVLLKQFVRWATGQSAPCGNLTVVEQSVPGQEEGELPDEQPRRGLPDGWIYNEDGWALLIESKINCPLGADQIGRHRSTAQRRGFTQPHILALITDLPSAPLDPDLKIRRWTELYTWLREQPGEDGWAKRLYEYMDILEAKLVAEEILTAGTLTVFTGVPFDNVHPYNYLEAKRVLRLAMEQLRARRPAIHPRCQSRPAGPGSDHRQRRQQHLGLPSLRPIRGSHIRSFPISRSVCIVTS